MYCKEDFEVGKAAQFFYHAVLRDGVVERIGATYVCIAFADGSFRNFSFDKMSEDAPFLSDIAKIDAYLGD